jgi:hypothetical protein
MLWIPIWFSFLRHTPFSSLDQILAVFMESLPPFLPRFRQLDRLEVIMPQQETSNGFARQSYLERGVKDNADTAKDIETHVTTHSAGHLDESKRSFVQTASNKVDTPLIAATGPPGDVKSKELSKRVRPIPWWWWWDIGAAVLSAVSMILIIALLIKVQNTPLQDWTLPIQPNSLIAVLTTISKTTMMVPIASCLGQLKWHYFSRQAHHLDHLQLFDDATRGPWGAFTILRRINSQATLASFLALTTIIALGVEPSAQQILGFTHGILSNQTATIGSTHSYAAKIRDIFGGPPDSGFERAGIVLLEFFFLS